MKSLRHILSVLMIVMIAVLAAGTVVERFHGTEFALGHVYGIVAFLSVLITYFGVNMFLGGVHAY